MRKMKKALVCVSLMFVMGMIGCSDTTTDLNTTSQETEEITVEQTTTEESKIASKEDMSEVEDVLEDGMTPILGNQIKDGEYDIEVNSSSAMFNITACKLKVQDGNMTAIMTMGGTGYLYVCMGTGEEAVTKSEDAYISFVENENGEHTFEVPVDALDQIVECTAFSKKKEKWYDRQLVFRAASLPADALSEGTFKSVEDLGLSDGIYQIAVTLEGGSGKASIASPAKLELKNGEAFLTMVWSSANYDYVKMDDVKYEWDGSDEFSTFVIPVSMFDWKIPIIADTVAMSEPHEISYTILLDSATIQEEK